MENKVIWSRTRDELVSAVCALGYPAEFGGMIAEHIGSPAGMERMISYLKYVRPEKPELIVDEMLSIKSDIDRWREKKECERANSVYNEVLNYGFGDEDDE